MDAGRLWLTVLRRRGRLREASLDGGGMRTRDDTTSSGVFSRVRDALRRGRLSKSKGYRWLQERGWLWNEMEWQ